MKGCFVFDIKTPRRNNRSDRDYSNFLEVFIRYPFLESPDNYSGPKSNIQSKSEELC